MGDLVQFPEKVTTDEYFGGCPECGKNDSYINVGRNHYFLCHQHKVFWYVGSNLFSQWREEGEGRWFVNKTLLASYRKVEPIHAEPTAEERVHIAKMDAQREHERKIDRGYGIAYGPNDSIRALGPDDDIFSFTED